MTDTATGASAPPPPTAPGAARCFALVPCAGLGERAGGQGPKQYHRLGTRSVIGHTLKALAQVGGLSGVLVVLAPQDTGFERAAPGFSGWRARIGGQTRAHSVLAGLRELMRLGAGDQDWVLVHDAARCLLRASCVERLITACYNDDVGGLLAVPVPDTLKREDGGRVVVTVARSSMWAAQTPQMFRLGMLRQALEQALLEDPQALTVTDEASAIERLGLRPRLIEGDADNFKLTWPQDFVRAQRMLDADERSPASPVTDDS